MKKRKTVGRSRINPVSVRGSGRTSNTRLSRATAAMADSGLGRARLIGLGAVVFGVVFALFGGEYSTIDLRSIERSVAQESTAVAALILQRDSLAAFADSVENNPVTQERIARERFGMLRPGEMLYRVDFLGSAQGRD